MSQTDAAAHAFRKAASPVTEENMKPDMELVTAMNKAGIRVQDLVIALNGCGCGVDEDSNFHKVRKFCRSFLRQTDRGMQEDLRQGLTADGKGPEVHHD